NYKVEGRYGDRGGEFQTSGRVPHGKMETYIESFCCRSVCLSIKTFISGTHRGMKLKSKPYRDKFIG
ncbi:jg606, partial [Pararge aegeria aegeria]